MHRDNHYVPKLYLKQWVHEGRIPTYRVLVPHEKCSLWKDQSLKAVAFHQNLYTYVTRDGETDEFERWMDQEFESPAEEAIRRVLREQTLTPEHWRRLVRFALAQDVRTPARLREFLIRQSRSLKSKVDEIVEDSVRVLETAAKDGAPLPPVVAQNDNPFPAKIIVHRNEDGSGAIEVKTTAGRRMWVWQMRNLLTTTVRQLDQHRWTILRAPAGISWPTTDNPLVRLNYAGPGRYDFGGGWGINNVDIFLPLSPRHLLYTCVGRRPPPRGTVLGYADAARLRRIIVEHADRMVFAQDKTDIHVIRPRQVSADAVKAEQAVWQNCHREQSEAEIELL